MQLTRNNLNCIEFVPFIQNSQNPEEYILLGNDHSSEHSLGNFRSK